MEPDIEKYLPELDEFDMTREKKEEYIRELWKIMQHFVDQAFGLDPVQIVLDGQKKSSLK